MGWSKVRGIGAGLAVAAVLVIGATITAGYFYLQRSASVPSGTVEVGTDQLTAPVHVQVDEYGVPYLDASTLEDLFFAQGYQHAVDRLFQMELLRRTASGRLAEIFGRAALPVDRLVRTLDLWGAAGRSAEALSAEERRLVEAYAAGVNARLRIGPEPLPPEFVILGFEPEPWTPRASLALGKVMALDLSPWSHELNRFHASQVLPPEKFEFVRPRYPEWAPTILADTVEIPSLPSRRSGAAGSVPGEPRTDARGGERTETEGGWDPVAWLSRISPFRASNAWAIAGSRTASGAPILANDMHLGLQAPPTWYLMNLRAGPGYRVAGFSLPGVPGIVVGLTPHVAWGFTNAVVDDMDFSVERVSSDGDRYRRGGAWRQFAVRRETIRVRGRDEPVVHRVRLTSRGPLITDAVTGLGQPLSVRWAASRATTELRGLLAMNRARDADQFDRAVQQFNSPQQNVVYATADGNIGYRMSGSVPLRHSPRGGSLSLTRAESAGDDTVTRSSWKGFWPSHRLPSVRDPEAGYLATANNLQAPNLFGVVGTEYPLPFRARRLVDRLGARRGWDVSSTVELQRDVRSLMAERLVGRAVRSARRAGEDSAAAVLEAWDREVAPDRRGATLFYLWLYRLRDLVAADEFAANEGDPDSRAPGARPREAARAASPSGRTYFPDGALLRLLESGGAGNPWIDDVRTERTETLAELEERAARHAAAAADGRIWGEVHREVHEHPLGRVPWLDALVGFDVGPVPGPGGPHTLRPGDRRAWAPMDGTASTPPLISRHGPSERFVAEMVPGGRSRGHFLIPTGQSGNPFSRHYRDLLPRWREGRLVSVPLGAERILARSVGGYRLAPLDGGETPAR